MDMKLLEFISSSGELLIRDLPGLELPVMFLMFEDDAGLREAYAELREYEPFQFELHEKENAVDLVLGGDKLESNYKFRDLSCDMEELGFLKDSDADQVVFVFGFYKNNELAYEVDRLPPIIATYDLMYDY